MRSGRSPLPKGRVARRRQARRWCGRAAALAILFQALLPAYAATAATTPSLDPALSVAATRVAICTGNGVIWAALDDDGRPVTPKPAPAKPCHFCPGHATILVSPKAPPLAYRARPTTAAPICRADAALRESVSLLPRPIRAPPIPL